MIEHCSRALDVVDVEIEDGESFDAFYTNESVKWLRKNSVLCADGYKDFFLCIKTVLEDAESCPAQVLAILKEYSTRYDYIRFN